MLIDLPEDWHDLLSQELNQTYFEHLSRFVDEQRGETEICPPEPDVFNAFKYTSVAATNVVFLGQDPYHGHGQAHGLCFSVSPGTPPPPSLINIFKELRDDIGCSIPNNGCLIPWARQGCLMLNSVLTVREGEANSHKYKGWEKFTDAVLRNIHDSRDRLVFVLWGNSAIKRGSMIDRRKHAVIQSAHPSPLSAHAGFLGSRPFSAVNRALAAGGKPTVEWQLPDLT